MTFGVVNQQEIAHTPAMNYLLIALIVACGAIIQGALGFAFGIFSIPLLCILGFPLEQAITLVLGLVFVQTVSSVWRNREFIPWREVVTVTMPRYLFVVLGVNLLGWIQGFLSPGRMKQFIGACLLLIILLQLWFRPTPRKELGLGWTWLAGGLSGIMSGLIGMGGPALVLWVVAHDWDSRKSRTLLWCAFALMVPWQLTVAYQRFGWPVLQSAGIGLMYAPLVVVATMVGNRIGDRISQERLRVIAYGILIAVGTISLASPYLG